MTRPTMVARLSRVQALVTLGALMLVVAVTWIGVSAILTWKTDRVLRDILARTIGYLDAGPADEAVDWDWLASEIEEIRPRGVRFEVRERATERAVISLGSGSALARFEPGCHARGDARVCGIAGRRYVASAASDGVEDLAARDQLMYALAFACVLAAAGVALASAAVTRRALHPLSDLAARVAAIEPGSGAVLEPKANLRELELLERRFADLVARFEQTLLREKQFTAHASHELRTPLTLARAEIEAIAAGTDAAGSAERALAALARLQSLIEALLWFARAQAPLGGEDMEVVNLADIVAQQLDEIRGSNAGRCIEERLPDEALVRGDEALLARVTTNLIENAIKHGADSDVHVELTRSENVLLLRVSNGGPAIPDQLLAQLFVPFVRGQQTTPGFGLGLAFSRAVARAHGGDVMLGNDQGGGTSALLRLPLLDWHDGAVAS